MTRVRVIVSACALVACSDGASSPTTIDTAPIAPPPQAIAPSAAIDTGAAPRAWTFAVLSDLHLPNYFGAKVDQVVAALVEMRVRFVVITGDSTNGSGVDGRIAKAPEWWHAVTTALRPLRDAGIGVLPVAGNHDAYLAWQRDAYATAFADLAAWAGPVKINPGAGSGVAAAPFSYSVDVDGVHLALAHVVATKLDRDVGAFLEEDLAAARAARHRIVLAHVPLSSVILTPHQPFVDQLGAVLERGKVGLYVAGHEHVVWDEHVALPAGGALRQVLVGCASGFYNYEPSAAAKRRAGCEPIAVPGTREPVRCAMPNGGGEFVLGRGRKNRHIQHHKAAFVVFSIDGDDLRVRPMTVDDRGRAQPFYLNDRMD